MERDEIECALEQMHARSFGWALACCGRDISEAEDVLQTTYVKILEGTARFDGRSTFRTWLFGVIRRTALERRRRFAVREKLMRLVFVRPSDVPPDQQSTLEHSADSVRLLHALGKLSNRQREVLELVFYHEMTIEEAASTLRISLGSARTHYERGKKNLAQRLVEAHGG